MISYEPFWQMISERKISQYHLIHYKHFSASQLHRLKKNEPVSTETIRQICCTLDCTVPDVMCYVPDSESDYALR